MPKTSYQQNLDLSRSEGSAIQIRHAKGFQIDYEDGLTLLKIYNGIQDRADTLKYVIVKKGQAIPPKYHDYYVVHTPIRRVTVFSTTNIGMLSLAESEDAIVGVSNPKVVNTPSVVERIKNGEIADVGHAYSPNVEILLEKSPDLVILTALPAAKFAQYQTLIDAGVPVVVCAAWLENSPLGRAEWVKLLAVLLGKETLVNEKFARIEMQYQRLASLADSVQARPTVLPGLAYKDSWSIPGGDSYVAQFLKDAGADYYWKNKKVTGSLKLDFEAVYPVALTADFWINPGTAKSIEELLAKDTRFREFAPVQKERVFNNNKQLNPFGGNAYWEFGVVQPQLILADLIQIFHPELISELPEAFRESTFYQQIK
ncbi:ABC transporter substrate-binding protein [Chloroherpeton thalassium]|uniref:ABC transporter substrate-binding protein n=1 Tax=Chloroherpeton thalassium TaxID=100716 RepID=UPI0002FA5A9A|nr:ABC transporter substrate-binding protein [Chloroherpeton thalassium]